MTPYLAPVERPKGLLVKIVYFFTRRQFGKVATPIAVFSARMPAAFLTFYGKIPRLDRKLRLPPQTAQLIRARVASINSCRYCMDTARWYVMTKSPENLERMDALPGYRTSPLFTDAERAALDYVTELTTVKEVDAGTFGRLARHYSEREICDIVWLVASEHVYNLTNLGLGIGSDGLCELRPAQRDSAGVTAAAGTGRQP
jgi:alkylhydroperoxidase family enzyme